MMYNHNVVLIFSVYFIACTFLHCIYFAPLCRILAYWLMLSVLNTTLNKDYSILLYSILFYKTVTVHLQVNVHLTGKYMFRNRGGHSLYAN